MRAIITRCKHCHKIYMYYASGVNGQYNNPDYCPECMHVIDDALAEIPVLYEGRYQEIPIDDDLLKRMQSIKNDAINDTFVISSIDESGLPFDDIELYVIDDKCFAYVKDNDIEHMYALNEYDIENQCFTGNYYETFKNQKDSFHWDRQLKMIDKDIKPIELGRPTGNLFYVDYMDHKINKLKKDAIELVNNNIAENDIYDSREDIESTLKAFNHSIDSHAKLLESLGSIGENLQDTNDKNIPEMKIFYLDYNYKSNN